MNVNLVAGVLVMMLVSFGGMSCSRVSHSAEDLPVPKEAVADELPAANEDAATQPEAKTGTAVLAAGCFWCVEAVFESLKGVISVESGYAGGGADTATYEQVSSGETKHAEAVRIVYDPTQITYGELLRVFFATHDPTQLNRQGPDWGTQYRTAIFYANDQQKRVAQAYIDQLKAAKVFDKPIATTLEPLDRFYPAEQYHQDFVEHHPDHPYVRQWAVPKLEKLHKQFGDELKDAPEAK